MCSHMNIKEFLKKKLFRAQSTEEFRTFMLLTSANSEKHKML